MWSYTSFITTKSGNNSVNFINIIKYLNINFNNEYN